MYNDYYFRFPNEATAEQALVTLSAAVAGANVDRVGTVYEANGSAATGWHVNVRLQDDDALPAELVQFQIDAPLYPKRVWANQDENLT